MDEANAASGDFLEGQRSDRETNASKSGRLDEGPGHDTLDSFTPRRVAFL